MATAAAFLSVFISVALFGVGVARVSSRIDSVPFIFNPLVAIFWFVMAKLFNTLYALRTGELTIGSPLSFMVYSMWELTNALWGGAVMGIIVFGSVTLIYDVNAYRAQWTTKDVHDR